MSNNQNTKMPEIVKISNRKKNIYSDLKEVYNNRELLFMLSKRQIRGRYTQTFLGIFWALIQPVSYMLILNLFFGLIGRFESGSIPYPLFLLSALVPYQFYVKNIGEGAASVLSNEALIGKVFFPRISFPIVTVSTNVIDFAVAFIFLLLLFVYYWIPFTYSIFLLPLFILNLFILSMGTAIFLSALSVKYRDVRLAIPTISQLLFFASPIWYPTTMIPVKYHILWGLNPLAGLVDGFRWSLFGATYEPSLVLILTSAIFSLVILISGVFYFRKVERGMVDIL